MAAPDAAPAPATAAADGVQYRGVARLADGKWRSYIVNRDGQPFDIGEFATAAAAALAHDRAILAILGPDAAASALNFRAAFSDTELRFLRGHHAPAGRVSGVVAMVAASGDGSYDAALARFAARAFDAYTDPELALDVAGFRLAHGDALRRRREEAAAAASGAGADPAARAKAERDAEREAFVEAAWNKATDEAWVESYHRRRRETGPVFEDENRWPPVVARAAVDVDVDWFDGEELLYLPHGSSYVDEMILGSGPAAKNTEADASSWQDIVVDSTPAQE